MLADDAGTDPPSTPPTSRPPRVVPAIKQAARTVQHHLSNHVGAGLVASVAYFDPGNWSVDLQAGSLYGYKLLIVVLLSGMGAVVLQTMATKLGCVTGYNLAQHCRFMYYDHPKHPKLIRWMVLYPMYALSEFAIIATDLAELLGSAIALVLLIPALPLWAAVLVTAADVFVILLVSDPSTSRKPVKLFELIIVGLVLVVFICFIILIVKVHPNWKLVMAGFLPSHTLVQNNALYTGIGILGATVMPHALFLGSSLATQDRVQMDNEQLPATTDTRSKRTLRQSIRALLTPKKIEQPSQPESASDRLSFIKAHLRHAIVDIITSLFGFAVTINSAILILAGTVFFYASNAMKRDTDDQSASLFDAYNIIHSQLGKGPAIIFAVALLCAGQSAAITATLAGQIVSEGYIAWRLSPFLTRTTTRLVALVPATVVAAVLGQEGINTLLVASQVSLSLVLPFVAFPLVYLTSSDKIMSIPGTSSKDGIVSEPTRYTNGRMLKYLGYLVFAIIILADVSAIVSLIIRSRSNSL